MYTRDEAQPREPQALRTHTAQSHDLLKSQWGLLSLSSPVPAQPLPRDLIRKEEQEQMGPL